MSFKKNFCLWVFNAFTDDENSTLSKSKTFADDKINVTLIIISIFDSVENMVGKGENASNQYFLLFLHCFEKTSFPGTSKGVIVWEWYCKRYMENLRDIYT